MMGRFREAGPVRQVRATRDEILATSCVEQESMEIIRHNSGSDMLALPGRDNDARAERTPAGAPEQDDAAAAYRPEARNKPGLPRTQARSRSTPTGVETVGFQSRARSALRMSATKTRWSPGRHSAKLGL
jgi:hypothetical protein